MPMPMPVLQLATKLCSTCSRPLNIRDTQQPLMVPLVAAWGSVCSSCGEGSKADVDDRIIGRNRANSSSAPSSAPSQPIPLPLASLTSNAVLTGVLSSVSNNGQGRLQFPQQYSPRNLSQDARSLGTSPYSPTRASYFLSLMQSPSAKAAPLESHTTIDPLVDITRLRVRSTGIGCLNPGETFLGIQTNQGKEHEVSVTIMVGGSLNPPNAFLVCFARTICENSIIRALCSGEHCPPCRELHPREGTRRVPSPH